MANRARSMIRGLGILGNSVCGLDFSNWRKVYNTVIIPTLTYGAQVWYTGIRQKGLVKILQTAQNEGIRKLTGAFRTSPVDPLHNLAGIPPISYVLPKLIHAYINRLWSLPPNAKILTIQNSDQCRYWPDHILPTTNLSCILTHVRTSTYRLPDPYTVGSWTHQHLTYTRTPSKHTIELHKDDAAHPSPSDIHLFITYTKQNNIHIGTYTIKRASNTILSGTSTGPDQKQALCGAIKIAVSSAITRYHPLHITLWLRPATLPDALLTLNPRRKFHLAHDICSSISTYLDADPHTSFTLRTFNRTWPGTPSKAEIRDLVEKTDTQNSLEDTSPKDAMWAHLLVDYTPSDHPSHIACAPPNPSALPPAITVALETHN